MTDIHLIFCINAKLAFNEMRLVEVNFKTFCFFMVYVREFIFTSKLKTFISKQSVKLQLNPKLDSYDIRFRKL